MFYQLVSKISINLLPNNPDLASETEENLREDFDRFAILGLPSPLEPYVRATYGIDLTISAQATVGARSFVIEALDAAGHQSRSPSASVNVQ